MIKRWIIRGIFFMVLALCIAAWAVCSRFDMTDVYMCEDGSYGGVNMQAGTIQFVCSGANADENDSYTKGLNFFTMRSDEPRILPQGNTLGFWYIGVRSTYEVTIPCWFLVLLAGVGAFIAWRMTRRKPRAENAFPVEDGN